MPESRAHYRSAPRHVRRSTTDGGLGLTLLTLVTGSCAAFAATYPRAIGLGFVEILAWAGLGLGLSLILLPPRSWPLIPWTAVVIGVWMGGSVYWSQDGRATFEGTLLYAAIATLAVATVWRGGKDRLPIATLGGLVLVAVSSIVMALFFQHSIGKFRVWDMPDVSLRSFQGAYNNRNILAYTIVLLTPSVFCVGRTRRNRLVIASLGLVSIVALLLQVGSTTGFVALAVVTLAAVPSLAARHPRTLAAGVRRRSATWWVAAALASAVVAVVLFMGREKLATLSGRTPLWRAVVDASAERPLGGFGWGTVWNYHWMPAGPNDVLRDINASQAWPLAHGHNAAIDLLPQIGVVGILLFVLLQVWSLLHLVRAPRSNVRTWALLTLLAVNVVGLTEPTWAVPLGWFLLVAIATVAPQLSPRRLHIRGPRGGTMFSALFSPPPTDGSAPDARDSMPAGHAGDTPS